MIARTDGPKRSSNPACPLTLIDLARQWYVKSAYIIVSIATPVNRKAEMKAGRSPKFNMPMARAPNMTVKFSHDKKVRSLAKKTLGSTRVGKAIRLPRVVDQNMLIHVMAGARRSLGIGELGLPGAVCRRGWLDMPGNW